MQTYTKSQTQLVTLPTQRLLAASVNNDVTPSYIDLFIFYRLNCRLIRYTMRKWRKNANKNKMNTVCKASLTEVLSR